MRPCVLLLVGLLALAPVAWVGPAAAAADAADLARAEHLARTRYHEGVPAAEARELSDAGVARLAQLLRDQSEARHHAQILEVLGMSGSPAAWPVLAAEAADPPRGEVGRHVLRRRVALRAALGHLARHDPRALALLLDEAAGSGAPPAWSCGRHRDAELAALLRRSSLHGLALSGRPEARRALLRLRRDGADPALAGEAAAALAELDRAERRRAAEADGPRGVQR
jgi:hypothetical protein